MEPPEMDSMPRVIFSPGKMSTRMGLAVEFDLVTDMIGFSAETS